MMLPRLAARLLPVIAFLLAAGPAHAGQLELDAARSRVEFAVAATVDSFTGQLRKHEVEVTLGPAGEVTAARFRFRCADLATGKDARDAAMQRWLESAAHPEAEFTLDQLQQGSEGVAGWLAKGRLRLHGVERGLWFPVTVAAEGPERVIAGEATLDTREHGLPVIRMLGLLKVDPLVRVKFELRGRVNP
jgi:polyisoprenoid-binding protein YceI